MRQLTYLLLSVFLFISCSDDNKYLEDSTNTTNINSNEDPKAEIPCEIDFNNASPNNIILIGCDLDLNNETITLPENVTIKFDGGSVTNGTLQFNGGLIDGKLLNIDLNIEGSARLISTDFLFEKEKWNIIEGIVSDEIALSNRDNLNTAMELFKSLRGYTFEINDVDFFVDVRAIIFGGHTEQTSIRVFSDTHVKMGDDCIIRMQPNSDPAGAIFTVTRENNVIFSGGHLWGDRYTHTYVTGTLRDSHEFGTGIVFRGVHNGTVEDVHASEFTGDAFYMYGTRSRLPDGTPAPGEAYCENITIRNNVFNKNRRQSISVIDADGWVIEGNILSNAGDGPHSTDDAPHSGGTNPRHNIDLEATRTLDDDGNPQYGQLVQNGIIRNNHFSGAGVGDIDLYTCNDIEIYGNTFTTAISNIASRDIEIYDNTFVSDDTRATAIHIKEFIRESTGEDENVNHHIYNNTIKNYEHGMIIGGTSQIVHNNTITNCNNGFFLTNGASNQFYSNSIISNISSSKGYYSYPTGIDLPNTVMTNEIIDVGQYGMLLKNVDGGDTELTFINCSFEGDFRNVDIRNSSDITITESVTGTVYQTNNTNITLENNN